MTVRTPYLLVFHKFKMLFPLICGNFFFLAFGCSSNVHDADNDTSFQCSEYGKCLPHPSGLDVFPLFIQANTVGKPFYKIPILVKNKSDKYLYPQYAYPREKSRHVFLIYSQQYSGEELQYDLKQYLMEGISTGIQDKEAVYLRENERLIIDLFPSYVDKFCFFNDGDILMYILNTKERFTENDKFVYKVEIVRYYKIKLAKETDGGKIKFYSLDEMTYDDIQKLKFRSGFPGFGNKEAYKDSFKPEGKTEDPKKYNVDDLSL